MLYEAIYVAPDEPPMDYNIIYQPHLQRYYQHFGRTGDICLVACENNFLIGAAWLRLFSPNAPGYAYIDEHTPELSIALFEPFRNKGLGTCLINNLLEEASSKGYSQISLSVNPNNPAFELYKKLGFIPQLTLLDSCVMIKKI